MLRSELLEKLQEALAEFPEKQRTTILLCGRRLSLTRTCF
jgi:DNA-directed RNA polymerase specialized sigma24 family protein